MALDKSTDMDEIYNINGYEYIVDKEFFEKAKPIKIDFQGEGFKLESSIKIEGGCKGCESDSKSNSCG
jgi:iron-sulfur cluster assembly protein